MYSPYSCGEIKPLGILPNPLLTRPRMAPSLDLQVLIFCGPGLSFNTFTSAPEEFPKALIPIANRPMIWYPLDWCHRMSIFSESCGFCLFVEAAFCVSGLYFSLATVARAFKIILDSWINLSIFPLPMEAELTI